MAEMKKVTTPNIGKDAEKMVHLCIAGGDMKY